MPQVPAIAGQPQDASPSQISDLRARINDLKLRASDLQTRRDQLSRRVEHASPAERPGLEQQQAGLSHDYMALTLQIDAMNHQLSEMETTRDMSRLFSFQGPPSTIATTAPPPAAPNPVRDFVLSDGFGLATFALLLPFAIAMARRVWTRNGPRPAADLEHSPRLQRMEQAIEAIALEVERIGEAQRFTTKLLSDRHSEGAQHLAPIPRREPGTITPH